MFIGTWYSIQEQNSDADRWKICPLTKRTNLPMLGHTELDSVLMICKVWTKYENFRHLNHLSRCLWRALIHNFCFPAALSKVVCEHRSSIQVSEIDTAEDHASAAVLGWWWNRLFMKTFACINWLFEPDLTGEATLWKNGYIDIMVFMWPPLPLYLVPLQGTINRSFWLCVT